MVRKNYRSMSDIKTLQHVHSGIKSKFRGKKIVFGFGSVDAKIVFVSEMIGPDEEKEGKPIAGAAAKLLNGLLKTAGIDKRKVYITTVIKYHPGLAHPTPKEIKSHANFLRDEIKTVGPQVVVTLGNLALNGVGLRQPVENVHGRAFHLGDHELFPTFHPSHALKDKSVKALLEADFIKLKQILELRKQEPIPSN